MLFAGKVPGHLEEVPDLHNLKPRILPRDKERPLSEAGFEFGPWS